ncbi:hypothetical protein AGMMS50268_33270 [Spirochaetia bacterium]|nr:hypothetical protein AGMMS50268_33270 [Spirochaetia bacterium]
MKIKRKLTVVLLAAVFAFGTGQMVMAQAGGMGGHGAGMTQEDPIPFTRDMEKAAADILSQAKAGRIMDARNSVTRLTSAMDKVLPHITETALKNSLSSAVGAVRTTVAANSPDLFDLEDKIEALQTAIVETRNKLQGMK